MKATNRFRKCTLIASMMIGSFQSNAQVPATKPDLVVSSFTLNGPINGPGTSTITYTVANRATYKPRSTKDPTPVLVSSGPATISSVTVTAYWNKDGTWINLGSKNISTAAIKVLESGKSISGTFTTTKFVPARSTAAGIGDVWNFQLRVDEGHAVTEYNETNNNKNFSFEVPN